MPIRLRPPSSVKGELEIYSRIPDLISSFLLYSIAEITFHKSFCSTPYTNIAGKGDLVGCDISKHLTAAKDADHAGEHGFIVKSSCDVRALTYCDLKCIHIPGLIDVLRLYPEFKDQGQNVLSRSEIFLPVFGKT